jgi:hypothetical protein
VDTATKYVVINRWLLILLVLSFLFFGYGCGHVPRVFQAKIDPTLAQRSPEQVEAERAGAEFIEQKSAVPVTTIAEAANAFAEIHVVASGLSSSLGEPKQVVTLNDHARIVAALKAGKLAEQQKAEKWKAFALKYADKPIEGTGFSLAGPAGLVALAAVIAACVAFPPIGYALIRMLPVLWGYFKQTSAAIEGFVKDGNDPDEKLRAQYLGRKMDEAQKKLVRQHFKRATLPPGAVPSHAVR